MLFVFVLLCTLSFSPMALACFGGPGGGGGGGGGGSRVCSGKPEKWVLLIGNSYTDSGVDSKVKQFLEVSEPGFCWMVSKYVRGGQTLAGHARDPNLTNKLRNEGYDHVVIQAQSQEPSFSDAYVQRNVYPAARQLVSNIRVGSPNANIVFFDTWGRRNAFDGMQDRLTARYIEMAKMNKPASVAPVGEAFRHLKKTREDLFRGLYTSDNSHPTRSGAYVAASTISQTISGKSNVGSSFTDGLGANAQTYNDAANFAVQSRNWIF